MDSQKKEKNHLSRREFLRMSAISATAVAGSGILAGCAQEPVVTEAAVEEAAPAAAEAAAAECLPRYDLDKDTAYALTMEKHSWDGWYYNAPNIHEYKKDPPYKVGYITGWRGEMWQEVNIAEFTREVERSAVIEEMVYMDSAGSVDTEISNLQNMLTMWKGGALDGIICDPLDPYALNDIIGEIYDAGCPIILYNDAIDSTKYTSFVSDDPWTFGTQGAEWLVKKLDEKGKILFLRGLQGYPIDNARSGGALSVFDQYPDIEIAAIDYAEWSYDKAKKIFTDMVTAHPEFDGIYTVGGQMSEAVVDAMIELDIDPAPYPHASEDENGFMQKSIEYGFPAFASCHPSIVSAISVKLMDGLLQGYPTPKCYFFPTPVITDDKFKDYVRPNVPTGVFVSTPLTDEEINTAFEAAGIK